MTKPISLIAVDLDGTLLTSEKKPAEEGARLLGYAARAGIYVIISTTRNPDVVQHYCRELGIDHPVICTNGAQIWGSPEGPVWAEYAIPRPAALAITRLADEQGWDLSLTIGPKTYLRGDRDRPRPAQASRALMPEVIFVSTNSEALLENGGGLSPFRIIAWQPEAIDAIRNLNHSKLDGQCRIETFLAQDGAVRALGVFAAKANKGTALAYVMARLGIGRERVMVIGDNQNDLPMFPCARISVAMANGPAGVKQQASVVAPSNDEEGVAWAIKAFVTTL